MGWAPVEDIAGVVLKVAGVGAVKDLQATNEKGGYFHAVNPSKPDWEGVILPALRDFYGERITRDVPLTEWVDELEKSAASTSEADEEKNPGVKLLDAYRLAASKGGVEGAEDAGWATQLTEQASERWCEQGQF
ncbi:hypothetical protein BJX66DRAFT_344727 [Aspergillus keveii]|uniref:Uncharacterized protein n=1 Tax=Aspergillus keveii TaxID=714993 RepID=A0ABR4FKA4_9EURO